VKREKGLKAGKKGGVAKKKGGCQKMRGQTIIKIKQGGGNTGEKMEGSNPK